MTYGFRFAWLLAIFAVKALADPRPLDGAPAGWTIEPAEGPGLTEPWREALPDNEWLLVKPPDDRPGLPVDKYVVDQALREKMPAEELYGWARKWLDQHSHRVRDTKPMMPAKPPPVSDDPVINPKAPRWVLHRVLGSDGVYGPATCHRLKMGETFLVREGAWFTSPTGVTATYELSRPAEDVYVARLHLAFKEGKGYDLDVPPAELDTHYRAKINRCLQAYAPALRDPETKAWLRIELSDDPHIPLREISIRGPGHRSNSLEYASGAGCTTILHELLHLLGLVDEYEEKAGVEEHFHLEMIDESGIRGTRVDDVTEKLKFNCRVLGPADSIMFWQDLAVKKAIPVQKIAVKRCVCAPGVDCRQLVKKSDGLNCPEGSALMETLQSGFAGEEIKARNDANSFLLTAATHEVIMEEEPEGKELLYPAHFRVITEPGCEDVNALYYACARNAYRFEGKLPKTLDEAGVKVAPHYGCRPMPPQCRDPNQAWVRAKRPPQPAAAPAAKP